jgi:hypothetical protein
LVVAPLAYLSFSAVAASRHVQHPWVNHDVAAYFVTADSILDGNKLYSQLYETNPPTYCFLIALLRTLSRTSASGAVVIYHHFVFALGLCGALMLGSVLRRTGNFDSRALLIVMAYMCLPTAGHIQASEYGQREQVFAIVFLPYVFLRVSGIRITGLQGAFVLVTSLLATMKPHFVALIGVVELCCFISRRQVVAAVWGALTGGFLLPAVLLLAHSTESFVSMFTSVIPFHLTSNAYSFFDQSTEFLLGTPELKACLGGGAALLLLFWRCQVRATDPRLMRWMALTVCLVAFLLALQQQKYWSYHFGVVLPCLLVFNVVLFTDIASTTAHRVARLVTTSIVGLGLFVLLVMGAKRTADQIGTTWQSPILNLAPLMSGRRTVIILSPNIVHNDLTFYLGMRNVWSYLHDFKLPAIAAAVQGPEHETSGLVSYVEYLRKTIAAKAPDAILFSPEHQGLPPGMTTHQLLVDEGGLMNSLSYKRVSDSRLRRCCGRARDYIVYLPTKRPVTSP